MRARLARARSKAISYGRGSITKRRSPAFNFLVVMHKYFSDVTVHLRRDTDEVGANRSIIRLRPYFPLEQSYHYGDGCGPNDGYAKYSAYDAAGTGIRWRISFRHN